MTISPELHLMILGAALALALSAALHGGDRPAPRDEGAFAVPGLSAPVTVERDALAVPVIRGETLEDVARALGYIHAQERFFQMDLARRYAAGELSELIGPQTIESDERMRRLRFRALAGEVLENLPAAERALVAAYAQGVNAALSRGGMTPLEYTFLRSSPQAWTEADSILVIYSFFDALHMDVPYEKRLGVMEAALPRELFEFLTPLASRFDAPLLPGGGREMGENDYAPAPIPSSEVVNLRTAAAPVLPLEGIAGAPRIAGARGVAGAVGGAVPGAFGRAITGAGPTAGAPIESLVDTRPPLVAGSNNWAVAGTRTRDGRAILANDPHLTLSAPVVWYRADLRTAEHSLSGLSLPGVPGIVIGSNGHISWGATNTTADFQDLIIIEVDPDDPSRYRTPDGWEAFETLEETIEVRGQPARTLTIEQTRWGAVVDRDWQGRPLVLKWTALDPAMVNLSIIEMVNAKTVEEGLAVAAAWRGPSQNMLIADEDGRIGWVVSGSLPKRVGFDGRTPVSWADGTARWDGEVDEGERPMIIDPPAGYLFTANNRTVAVERCEGFANFWDLGTRARRIGQMLAQRDNLKESDLFEMQLDTRVELFDLYRDLGLEACGRLAQDELVAQAAEILRGWNGRADVDQPAVHLLQTFRNVLRGRIISPLVAPCAELDPAFRYRWWMDEEPLRRILEEKPEHFLPQRFESWEALVDDSFRSALVMMTAPPGGRPLHTPWGEINRADIGHPAAAAAPAAIAAMLGMPHDPLAGHHEAVRVALPSFGASARLVVSPGREEEGILHIPTGQSGHPLSPHYRDSHSAWVTGMATPFLSGPAERVLRLTPAENRGSAGEGGR